MSLVNTQCLQAITIPPGGSAVVPAGATLVAADTTGSVSLSSDCDSLDQQLDSLEAFQCYTIVWSIENSGNSGAPMDVDDNQIVNVKIGGVEYPVGTAAWGPADAIKSDLIAHVPQTLFNITSVVIDTLSNRYYVTVNFRTAPSVATSIEMKLEGIGYETFMYLKPNDVDCPS